MARVRFIAGLLSRWHSAFSFFKPRSSGVSAHLDLGRRGENLAAKYLRQNGYKILYRNFRAPKGGEVDIVCRDKNSGTLAFVEVKTRSSARFGDPSQAVTPDKQHLISRGALAWLRLLDNPDIFFRFDIVEVLIEEPGVSISLIRDAFQLSEPYIY
jgi:putative endonuclease